MRRALPYLALWLSLAYLVGALGVTGKRCFDSLRSLHRGVAQVGGMQTLNPAWVIERADVALEQLW